MVNQIDIDAFLQHTSGEGCVVVDVRTAREFASGHILGAVNLPLFTDEERERVGTLYVRTSRQAAIECGLEFVGPKLAGFVRSARAIAGDRPIYLYCARGGMRSGSMGWLLDTAGLKVSILRGGYKSYRAHLESLLNIKWDLILLSGATGCGKTELLQNLSEMGEQVIDLEGLANHKGSAFGGMGQREQPTTEHFINLLHERLLELDPTKRVWCEGESMLIGHVFLPARFYQLMQCGRQVDVTMDVEQRLDRLTVEYGNFPTDELSMAFGKIRKRLGAQNTIAALEFLELGDVRSAARVALSYYDKAYHKSSLGSIKIQFTANNLHMRSSAAMLIETLQ